jgi:hypothetical protein
MGLAATVVIVSRVGAAHGAAVEHGRPDSCQEAGATTQQNIFRGRFWVSRLRRAAAWDTNGEGLVASYA